MRCADGQAAVETIRKVVEARGGRVLHFPELVKIGEDNALSLDSMGPKPTEDDVYTIMYTSGSTGTPKGVLLTHKNMIASCESKCSATLISVAGSCALWRGGFYPKSDLLLAFLPLSHILEQVSSAVHVVARADE
jgi:long-chain acyl-CoA synthetase